MIDAITNSGIMVFGLTAMFMASSEHREMRWLGGVFGLIGQPFWIVLAITHAQWGVLAMCAAYGFMWMRMIWNNRKPKTIMDRRVDRWGWHWRLGEDGVWLFDCPRCDGSGSIDVTAEGTPEYREFVPCPVPECREARGLTNGEAKRSTRTRQAQTAKSEAAQAGGPGCATGAIT